MKKRSHLNHNPGAGRGTGFYTQEIVKCLEQAHRASGQRPYTVFDDWTRIVEASLTALPDQLKSVASTGRFGPDTPETGEVFKQVRVRYESAHYPAAHRKVWNSFARAFALLLHSAEPGLWGQHGYGQFDCGYMGPDVLGHVYATYANSDPSWAAQYWTPWNVALLMSALVITDGEREVYDRINVT